MKSRWLLLIGITAVLGVGAALYVTSRPAPDEAEDDAPERGGFSGFVVRGDGAGPVAGARVEAKCLTHGCTSAETVTAEDGSFAFELDDGEYRISAQKQGLVTTGRLDTGRTVRLEDATQYVNARIELWPPATVTGRVVTGNAGIAATVTAAYDRDASGDVDYPLAETDSDADGAFAITGAYAGTLHITIAAEGFAQAVLHDLELSAGQTLDLGDIPLSDGISIYGTVVDENTHRGISGATVSLVTPDGSHEIKADSHGAFRFPAIENGQATLEASAGDYRTVRFPVQLSGNPNQEVTVPMQRMWGLFLTVQNQTGRNPVKTYVRITDVTTDKVVYEETLDNGDYSLDKLRGGPFLIDADSYDHMTHQTVRAPAGGRARIHLKPYARVVCSFLKSDGTPLTKGQYRYWFRPFADADDSTTPWRDFDSATLEVGDLVEGFYRFTLMQGEDEVSTPEFELHHGDVRNVTLQHTEGGVIMGHVVSTEGRYNIRATVAIEVPDSDVRSVRTDREGHFTMDRLPTEPFTIVITPEMDRNEVRFDGITVRGNTKEERTFEVDAPRQTEMAKRRAEFEERRRNGEFPPPSPHGGRRPWGDGPPPPPPWANGTDGKPPWGDGPPPPPPWANGTDGKPPWGDGPPPQWGDGKPPWGDGKPPWGDGPPPWLNNTDGKPPWGDGPPPQWINSPDGKPPWGDGPAPWLP